MIAFIIWAIVGCLFIGFGIAAFFEKKATGFWANAKTPKIEDVKAYNRSMGIMWCVAGVVFILLGLPLLVGEDTALSLLSVVGCLLWVIALMVIYELVICKRYRKK